MLKRLAYEGRSRCNRYGLHLTNYERRMFSHGKLALPCDRFQLF